MGTSSGQNDGEVRRIGSENRSISDPLRHRPARRVRAPAGARGPGAASGFHGRGRRVAHLGGRADDAHDGSRAISRFPHGIDRVILPGHCRGDLTPVVERHQGTPVELGPEDLRDLPRHFGQAASRDGRLWPIRHRDPGGDQPRPAARPDELARAGRAVSFAREQT